MTTTPKDSSRDLDSERRTLWKHGWIYLVTGLTLVVGIPTVAVVEGC